MAHAGFWFRNDLRLADNPGLTAAAEQGPVSCFYILDPAEKLGGATLWWLHHSLAALQADLAKRGIELILKQGDPQELVPALAQDLGLETLHWNRRYGAQGIETDKALKAALQDQGLEVKSHKASLLVEPWELQTKTGGVYKVFTPFWKSIRANLVPPQPLPVPSLVAGEQAGKGQSLARLDLLPTKPDWSGGFAPVWTPGEAGALQRLSTFLDTGIEGYKDLRNRPDMEKVSRLSPHLRFGEISPRQVWAIATQGCPASDWSGDLDCFLSEIVWREFSYSLLYHYPNLQTQNWKPGFNAYPWQEDRQGLSAWQKGQTGYPIVDAGMRQLWHTGWMHNRVRMITASFLIKHLGIDWREGEAWFWDTLVDADLASNSASWQWVAGSGADASPYFRIFNPITQGEKFDPDGTYIRQWVPELARLPDKYLFAPWQAPKPHLPAWGVELGSTYPEPIVDHAFARSRALEGYEYVKQAAA